MFMEPNNTHTAHIVILLQCALFNIFHLQYILHLLHENAYIRSEINQYVNIAKNTRSKKPWYTNFPYIFFYFWTRSELLFFEWIQQKAKGCREERLRYGLPSPYTHTYSKGLRRVCCIQGFLKGTVCSYFTCKSHKNPLKLDGEISTCGFLWNWTLEDEMDR